MTNITNISYFKDDLGKNLYRKKTYYTLVVEQEVLAKDTDEADAKFLECGVDHSKINQDIAETKDGVETYMVDADYSDHNTTEYIGKVNYDDHWQPLEDAIENGDLYIDTSASENESIKIY